MASVTNILQAHSSFVCFRKLSLSCSNLLQMQKILCNQKGFERGDTVPCSAMVKNHDYCTGCGQGGPLLCCDYCPVSYHLLCLNPPLYRVPAGTWACTKCASKQRPPEQIPNSPFSSLFIKLRETNPVVFNPSEEIKDLLGAPTVDLSKRGAKKKQTQTIQLQFQCHTCKKELFSNRTDWISCSKCIRAFHLYCLEPMLYRKPAEGWYCSQHKPQYDHSSEMPQESEHDHECTYTPAESLVPADIHLLPEDSISLDFFPYSLFPTSAILTCTKPPLSFKSSVSTNPESAELTSQKMINKLSNQQTTNEMIRTLMKGKKYEQLDDYINGLEAEQKKVFDEVMKNFHIPKNSLMVPLMSQFIAWQRLMQVNSEIESLQQRRTNGKNMWNTLDEFYETIDPDEFAELLERNDKMYLLDGNGMNDPSAMETSSILPAASLFSGISAPLQPHNALSSKPQDESSAMELSVDTQMTEHSNEKTVSPSKPTTNNENNILKATSSLRTSSGNLKTGNAANLRTSGNNMKTTGTTTRTRKESASSSNVKSEPVSVTAKVNKKGKVAKKIRIAISGEDVRETTCELENTNSIVIGRADPRMPTREGLVLHLNLNNYLSTAAVRKVSHKHAEIKRVGTRYYIECHGRNGIVVDGVTVGPGHEATLENNQIIAIGPFLLTFLIDS